MKILFIRFPLESAFGGAEKQTLSLMEGLKQRSYGVHFLGSCPVLLEQTAALGISKSKLLIGPPPVTKWAAVSFLWRKKMMNKKLIAGIQELKPNAVIMLSLTEKLLLTEPLHRQGIKVFWLEHDRIGRWQTKNPWLKQLRRNSTLATTIVVSELSRKLYLNLGWHKENIMAIPNGIDVQKFSHITAQNNDHHSCTIGCIARLSPEKGIDVLIDAVSDLPEVQVRIVGTGREDSHLHTLIHERKLEERIRIEKEVKDIIEIYKAIDVLVLPSRDHDPFGLVAAEAMAAGIPVIVTDQCGIAGYLTDGKDALVVQAASSEALKKAIKTLLNDISLRETIGRNGMKTAHMRFGLERMIHRYEQLLMQQ